MLQCVLRFMKIRLGEVQALAGVCRLCPQRGPGQRAREV